MISVVVIKTPEKVLVRGWLKGSEGREYGGGIDKRTYAKWKEMGLRTVKVGGLELTRPEWIDEFLMGQDPGRSSDQEHQAKELVKQLRATPRRRKLR